MKTYAPTIKKPLLLKPNYKLLPYQYQQNFRASSVITNSGFFPSRKSMPSTTASFPRKTFKSCQMYQTEESEEETFANENDVLLNTNSNYDDIIFDLSRTNVSQSNESFSRANPAKSMRMKFEKYGTETAIVALPRMIVDQDKFNRMKAMEQKKELLEILETDNLSAADILLKISTYSTPYSKLLKLAYEELQYATTTSHSTQIDELERNSAVTSAKNEIEVQQLADKSIKLKNEFSELKKNLKKSQNRLQNLNEEIADLNKLAEIHNVEANNKAFKNTRSEITESDDEKIENKNDKNQKIPLDDDLYKKLWTENINLLDEIDKLQKQLVKTQEMQVITLHECAQKIIKNRKLPNNI